MSADANSILGGEAAPTGLDAILQGKPSPVKNVSDLESNNERSKLKGLHRELYDLIGGRAPMVEQSTKAKARLGKKPCSKWVWRPFTNQARTDELKLSHWIKEDAALQQEKNKEVYPFSKFDKPSRVPHYNRDDYLRHLADDDWTEEETGILFELCRKFDLRFIVIHDHFKRRFPPGTGEPAFPPRSVEDLKARYYWVWTRISKARNEARKVRSSSVDVTYRYDAKHEKLRKEQLRMLARRTLAQCHEEQLLKSDQKKIRQHTAQVQRAVAAQMNSAKRQRPGEGPQRPLSGGNKKAKSWPEASVATAKGAPFATGPTASATATTTAAVAVAASAADAKEAVATVPDEIQPAIVEIPGIVTTHLRSTAVDNLTRGLKPKQAQMASKHLADLGFADPPLGTAAVTVEYAELVKCVVELVAIEAETDTKTNAVAAKQRELDKKRPDGKRPVKQRKR